MKTVKSTITILSTLLLLPLALYASQAFFGPDLYVHYNTTIVEGAVMSDTKSDSLEWHSPAPGWYFPTKCSQIIVDRVIRREAGSTLAAGDTIQFYYPSDNRSRNENVPDQIRAICDISDMSSLQIGIEGIFPFRVHERFGFIAGAWFLTTEDQQKQILDFVAHLDADSTKTVAKFRADHFGRRFKQ